MAQVFQQALQADPQQSAYQMLLRELQQPQPAPAPMFNPQQVRDRIAQNNQQVNLGLLGQMAGDDGMRSVGGQVFRTALAGRQERVSDRGVTDPLTGETQIDPEYANQQQEQRRGRVLQQALNYESAREREKNEAAAREAEARRAHEYRMAEGAARRAQGARVDAGMNDLKKQLVEAQIEATKGRTAAAVAKAEETQGRAKIAASNANARADMMIGMIDRALGQTGPFTTGMTGNLLARVRGGEAYDLRKTIDTIKANVGFAELQAMREASPTGGALGQVAVRELDMLQATLGSLDADQSEDQLRNTLNQIRGHYDTWRNTVRAAAQGTEDRSLPPGAPGAGPTPVPPQPPGARPGAPGAAPAPAQPGVVTHRLVNGKLVPI